MQSDAEMTGQIMPASSPPSAGDHELALTTASPRSPRPQSQRVFTFPSRTVTHHAPPSSAVVTSPPSLPARPAAPVLIEPSPARRASEESIPSQPTTDSTTSDGLPPSATSATLSHTTATSSEAHSWSTQSRPSAIDPNLRTFDAMGEKGAEGFRMISTGDDVDRESLHAPGAVQRFGCLFALEEDESTGNFRVSSCSENTDDILGITPTAFFAADTFTSFLSTSSVDSFLDAVDAMHASDPSASSSDPESNEDLPKSPLNGIKIPPEHFRLAIVSGSGDGKKRTSVFASLHRPDESQQWHTILELEPVDDAAYPRSLVGSGRALPTVADLDAEQARDEKAGMEMDPTAEEIIKSTLSALKPLRALAGKRRREKGKEINLVQLVYQIEQQFRKAKSLETFWPIATAILKELTGFDRCCIVQINAQGDGLVISEQVDRTRAKALHLGHTFPAHDLSAASHGSSRLSMIYDVDAASARMVSRDAAAMDWVMHVALSRCPLRAPTKGRCDFLRQTGVRSSTTISLLSFSSLWGVVQLSSYGASPHRVTPAIRQLLAYLGESLGRTIERLSHESRLKARRLITISATREQPTEPGLAFGRELLVAFKSDFGCLSLGREAKIFGKTPSDPAELYRVLGYLRSHPIKIRTHSQEIAVDFPGLHPPDGQDHFLSIAGVLIIPLSPDGESFMLFCKEPDEQKVVWAGNQPAEANAEGVQGDATFKVWSTVSVGRSSPWPEEVLDIAAVLGTIYSRSLTLWKEKDQAIKNNSVTSLLLANASHEVRTPLNAIVNYLELALGAAPNADLEKTLVATKNLVAVVDDLLDLTKHERNSGKVPKKAKAFDLRATIDEAVASLSTEARRRGLKVEVVENPQGTPTRLLGDPDKIRAIISTAVDGAVKHTTTGSITVEYGEISDGSSEASESAEVRKDSIRIAINIIDTGAGISVKKLDAMFAELHSIRKSSSLPTSVGLGLATTARLLESLDGQLRVESEEGKGSKFSYVIPFLIPDEFAITSPAPAPRITSAFQPLVEQSSLLSPARSPSLHSYTTSFSSPRVFPDSSRKRSEESPPTLSPINSISSKKSWWGSNQQISESTQSTPPEDPLDPFEERQSVVSVSTAPTERSTESLTLTPATKSLKILVVEDDKVNRLLIDRRLTIASHRITVVCHGGEAVRAVEEDPTFDLILMDLNMPICDGYEASAIIRQSEPNYIFPPGVSRPPSHILNNGIPIIAVTANSQERGREQLIEAGIDGWCLKPIRFARLADLIAGATDLQARQRNLYRPGQWEDGGWLTFRRS